VSLLTEWLNVTQQWEDVFPQPRTHKRALRQALASLVCLGRRCLSRIIWTHGGQQRSWSAEYFLHSRCHWEPQQLFQPIFERALPYCPQRLIGIALDDTRLRKTGRSIPQAFYQRDPMSPPFHVNLTLGLRFLQASLLLPLHRNAQVGARAVPVRFEEVSRVKRPGKKATEQMKQEYRAAVKQHNLSTRFVDMGQQLRTELDQAGGRDKLLALTGDGSFCNRTCFRQIPERSVLLVRARKDAKLCFRAPADSRRFYAVAKFTPEQVRKDDNAHPWKTTKIFYGGKRRKVRYKVVTTVYWQRGARQMPLRLIVVAPTAYRKAKSKRLYYRDPAYLLTTDLRSSVNQLLQIYFDRWQIEVNHREEKHTLGVGQAQLWNATAVPKQPVLAVAAYSALLLAALQAFGPERSNAYTQLPKWRPNAHRPSCLDLVTLLRKEMTQQTHLLTDLEFEITDKALVQAAAA
jgi:DDE superfamily endonuclease